MGKSMDRWEIALWGTVSFLIPFAEGSHFLGGIRNALQPQGSLPRHRDGEWGLGDAAGQTPQGGQRDTAGLLLISDSHGGASRVVMCVCVCVCVCVCMCVCCGEARLGIVRLGTLVLSVINQSPFTFYLFSTELSKKCIVMIRASVYRRSSL